MLWGPVATMGLPAFKIQKHMPEKHGSLRSVHSLPPSPPSVCWGPQVYLSARVRLFGETCSEGPGAEGRGALLEGVVLAFWLFWRLTRCGGGRGAMTAGRHGW